jgi:hypothetical protein
MVLFLLSHDNIRYNAKIISLAGATLMKKMNKRDYFRVNISIPIKWHYLNQEESDLIKKGLGSRLLNQSPFKTPIDEKQVTPPSSRDDKMDQALRLLNAKLDYIINMMIKDSAEPARNDRVVEISASGLKFTTVEKIEQGAIIKMELLIPGSPHFMVELVAEVLRIEEKYNEFLNAVNILFIDDEARELIVKLGFEKQRIDIRRSKTVKEADKNYKAIC